MSSLVAPGNGVTSPVTFSEKSFELIIILFLGFAIFRNLGIQDFWVSGFKVFRPDSLFPYFSTLPLKGEVPRSGVGVFLISLLSILNSQLNRVFSLSFSITHSLLICFSYTFRYRLHPFPATL
jgi:hypothetical protein